MTIQCSTNWPKKMGDMHQKPTFFVEKIWASLFNAIPESMYNEWTDYNGILDNSGKCVFDDMYFQTQDFKSKPHTIRADKKSRWYAGRDIHFKIWQGVPYHSDTFQFAPVIKCTGVQKIEIIEMIMTQTDFCYQTEEGKIFKVIIDGITLWKSQIEELAINDGFETLEHFFRWFNKDFTGKLIHWTDLRY